MVLDEKDIDFSKIDWKTFEELCFDLLLKYHFHSLQWRQGGADKGRDIEASFTVTNPIILDYKEKWFVECKHLDRGLKVTDISEKVDWADAQRADHLLIITSTYLTTSTREWLEAKGKKLSFPVHELNGKLLKQRLLAFPELVIKYFFSAKGIAISEMLKLWVLFDILPDAKSLYTSIHKAELQKFKTEYLIFLLYCLHSLRDELERYCEDKGLTELDNKGLFAEIARNNDISKTQFDDDLLKSLDIHRHFFGSTSRVHHNSDKRTFFLRDRYKDKIIELYFIRHDQKFEFNAALHK